jgi:hypothetical protein
MSRNKGHEGQGRLQLVKNFTVPTGEEQVMQPETGQLQLLKTDTALQTALPIAAKLNALQQENAQLLQSKERLGNSVVRLMSKLEEQIVSEIKPDVVVSHAQDLDDEADVAEVGTSLPAEPSYPYTTKKLAEFIGMNPSRLGRLFTLAKIKGNRKYHYPFPAGKNPIQMYKPTALEALYEAALRKEAGDINEIEMSVLKERIQIIRAFK